MSLIRQPAVANRFYPGDPHLLQDLVVGYLDAATTTAVPPPKAMIVPHAGYVYSGPIAASAYVTLQPAHARIERVVLLGPAHRLPFHGLAAPRDEAFLSPLGSVFIDHEAIARVAHLAQVRTLEEAHMGEHSLEVQLPFLQTMIDRFSLVPFVVGETTSEAVAEVLEILWGGEETLIVISSDLSHYHDYQTAREMDRATSQAIETLAPQAIGHDQACGRIAVNGLLRVARRKGLQVRTLDLRNSGDTAGPRDQVVGYGAYVFH